MVRLKGDDDVRVAEFIMFVTTLFLFAFILGAKIGDYIIGGVSCGKF